MDLACKNPFVKLFAKLVKETVGKVDSYEI